MKKILPPLPRKRPDAKRRVVSRAEVGKRAGIVGVAANLSLCVLKIIIGALSGSLSILSDGLNNLFDAMSSVVASVSFHLGSKPADREHPFGHARYEYLSALFISVLILVLGGRLVVTSVGKIVSPTPIDVSAWALLLLVLCVGVKLWMFLFYRTAGRRIASNTLLAASKDSFNDAVATTAVLISALIQMLFGVLIDGVIGLLVALFIVYSGIKPLRETITLLLGRRTDETELHALKELILSDPKILGVHDLLVHDYGPGQCFASAHVQISAEEDALSCHAILDAIEREALQQRHIHLVLHCDPVLPIDREK